MERFRKEKEEEQRENMSPPPPKGKDEKWVRLAKAKTERLVEAFSAPMLDKKRSSRRPSMVHEEEPMTYKI